METENESAKSKELLFRKPNPFEWSDYSIKNNERLRKYIMSNPYGCDECGDTYHKNDLIKVQTKRVCRNCLCSGS